MVNWNARVSVDRRILLGIALAVVIVVAVRSRISSRPQPSAPAAQATPAQTAEPVAPKPLPPDPQDIVNLTSADHATQYRAAQNLVDRELTPELIDAIRSAQPASRYGNQFLKCLQARLPGPEGFENALRLPEKIGWLAGDDADEAKCKIPILLARKEEDPNRVANALGFYAIDMNAEVIGKGRDALMHVPATTIPPSLAEAIMRGDTPEGHKAIEAAADLGVGKSPKLFEDALANPEYAFKHRAAYVLAQAADHEAAQVVARALVTNPRDSELVAALRLRERNRHDGYAALAEIATDASFSIDRRTTALELISEARDPKIAAMLTPLTHSADASLRTYAAAAVSQISGSR